MAPGWTCYTWDSQCIDWTMGITVSARTFEIKAEAAAWRPDGMGTSEPRAGVRSAWEGNGERKRERGEEARVGGGEAVPFERRGH